MHGSEIPRREGEGMVVGGLGWDFIISYCIVFIKHYIIYVDCYRVVDDFLNS